MNISLPGGAVAPHWMRMGTTEEMTEATAYRSFNNTTMREGWIIAKHYPQDEGYETYHDVVYDVLVAQTDGEYATTWDTIRNCAVQSSLGNNEDQQHGTLRAPDNWKGTTPDQVLVQSSTRVIVSFLDGRSNQGVITGCLSNPFATHEAKDDGHNYSSQFNGIKTTINSDGEYQVTFIGTTIKADNTVTALDDVKDTTGTYIKLTKEGNVLLDDDAGESILIDKANKTITITARSKTENTGDWTVNVKGNVNVMASGNSSFNATGKTFLGSTSASQNVVLGKELQKALKEFADIIMFFQSTPSIPGQPVLAGPVTQGSLQKWLTKYGTPVSPFLSKKKFTE